WTVQHAGPAARLGLSPDHASCRLLVLLIHAVSLVLFAVFCRRLFADTVAAPGWIATAAAAAACLLIPIHFGYSNFLYDYPALALFTLGLALLKERRRNAFYA